jgi:hypothetical protein
VFEGGTIVESSLTEETVIGRVTFSSDREEEILLTELGKLQLVDSGVTKISQLEAEPG